MDKIECIAIMAAIIFSTAVGEDKPKLDEADKYISSSIRMAITLYQSVRANAQAA